MDYKGKFLESKEIVNAEESELKTPLGAPILRVQTEDGRIRYIPAVTLEKIASDEPCDATTFRDERAKQVVERILEVLTEYDLPISHWDYVQAIVGGSLRESFNVAEEIKWGTAEKTVLDIDRILKSNKKTLADILKEKGVDK